MDAQNNDINLDDVHFDEDEVVVDIVDEPEAPGPMLDIDEELLKLPFDRDVILFADLVATGMPIDMVRWYLTRSPAERKDLSAVFQGAMRATPESVNLDVVEKFASSTKATRNKARNLKVTKLVNFHTLLGFHTWMIRQPDVAFLNATTEEDEDGKTVLVIGYKRGRFTVTIPLNVAHTDFGKFGVKWNSMLQDMFADRPYKPQIKSLPPKAYNIIAGMFLVGDLKHDPETGWVRYEAYGDPMYCPRWQDPEVAMPDGLRRFYHEIWVANFRTIDRNYLTEVVSHFEYVAQQLVIRKYRFNEDPPVTLHGFKFIENEFLKLWNSSNNGLFKTTFATEINIGIKAIDRSRGFRGTKSVLDGLTHAMFESRPIGVLGDSVGHARLIALLDQALIDRKAKGVVLYAEKFSGEVEHFLSFITKRSRPYSVTARVRVLEDQEPVVLLKGSRTETPFDLNHDKTPISPEFGHDIVVWFYQNPSESKSGTKNFFEANDSSHKALLNVIGNVKPLTVLVPIHLSFLSPEHTFSKLVLGAERMQMLVHWTRGHNTEMWLQFSGYAASPNPELVDKLNYGFAMAARRKKLVNKVRDYLISGGHIFDCLGVPLSNEMAEEALHVYCTTRRYVESLEPPRPLRLRTGSNVSKFLMRMSMRVFQRLDWKTRLPQHEKEEVVILKRKREIALHLLVLMDLQIMRMITLGPLNLPNSPTNLRLA